MSVYTPTYGPVYGGGFPLDIKVALQLGGTWTDVTSYAYNRTLPAFTITRGRPDETTQVSPSQMTGQLNNRDGRFTSRNPTGPYYGQLGRNTPIRLSVPAQYVTLRIEDDTVSAAAAAFTAVTGDIDVRLEMDLSGWSPACLVSNWDNWALVLNGDGTLGWWIDQSSTVTIVGSTVPVPLGHGAVRVTRAESTGVVTFYTSATIGGSWTQLGAAVTSVTGDLGSASENLTVGYDANVTAQNDAYGGPSGIFYDAQVYSGISGTLKAEPAFTSQTAGATSWTDGQGNSWMVTGTATIDGRSYRYHGEMSSLPVAWDPSGRDIWVPFTAGGILRRLQQGNAPVISVMRRGVTSDIAVSYPILVYWPCEDALGATSIASGLPGGTPMGITAGYPAFQATAGSLAADTVFTCSAQLPQVQSSTWSGAIPPYSGSTVAAGFLLSIPSGGLTDGTELVIVGGPNGYMELTYYTESGGSLAVGADGTLLISGPGSLNGTAMWIRLATSSSNTTLTVLMNGETTETNYDPDTETPTPGPMHSITVNRFAANLGETEIGHLWFSDNPPDLQAYADLLNAYSGETAATRFARICTGNGVAPRIYGYPDVSAVMGPQQIDTLPNILQSCEDADRGMIYEPSEARALGYRTLHSLCNQAAAVTLDYSLAEVGDQEQQSVSLTSVDDDQYTRNDITATRSSGSISGGSYQAQLNDGSAMSVTAPPAGVGDYANSVTVNVQEDTQLPGIAQWMVHIGTVNEERYPQVVTGLHRLPIITAGLGYAIQSVRIGDYAEIINTPGWLPPGPVSQIVAGATETLTSFLFQVSWNAIPESPYEVAACGTANAETSGSTLDDDVTSSATSLGVTTTGVTGGGSHPLFGAYPGSGNAAPNAGYESADMANRQLDAYYRYYAFSSGTFPTSADNTLMNAGRIGVFSLQNQFGSTYTITWADVAAGSYDTDLDAIGAAIQSGGNPCMIAYEPEPDDSGKIGSGAGHLGTASNYIAAFQHVATLLRAAAPGLVTMCYVPYGPTTAAADCYPGDSYADIWGFDPYDATLSHGTPLATYTPVITWLDTDPVSASGGAGSGGGHGIPLGIFETGVDAPPVNTDAHVAAWIDAVPAALASLATTWGSKFTLWMWFNASGTLGSTVITPGSLSATALATIGASSFFTSAPTVGPPLWTTSAGDLPFNIMIAGEEIEVTDITGASSPQTFTVTRSVNGVVKAQAAGAAVTLASEPVLALT